MAKKIKRFFVFLFFSFFFALLSGRIGGNSLQKVRQMKSGIGINTAWAKGACCEKGICTHDDGKPYCC